MCKMNVVVNKLLLGNRVLGYECWSGKEVMEYTEKQLKDMIVAGKQKVCGLTLNENGELVLDEKGFFTKDMTLHTHIGNWKSMNEENMYNLLYICIGNKEKDGKQIYNCISSRFEQLEISEEDMRAYLKIGIVSGGAKLDGEKIIVASTEIEKAVEEQKADTEQKAETEQKEVKKNWRI